MLSGTKAIKDIGNKFNGGKAKDKSIALIILNMITPTVYELLFDTYKFSYVPFLLFIIKNNNVINLKYQANLLITFFFL